MLSSRQGDTICSMLLMRFRYPNTLNALRILRDYLKNRRPLYQTCEGQKERTVTVEAAQGSVLGPELWNLAYDSLLKLEVPEETIFVGYADDVAAMISVRSVERTKVKIKQLLLRVRDWFMTHCLSLALTKTETVILTKKGWTRSFPSP